MNSPLYVGETGAARCSNLSKDVSRPRQDYASNPAKLWVK